MAKEINLENASPEDFQVIDENNIRYLYGGRYTSDEYIQVEDENGKPKNMHKVVLELVCDDDQFIALIKSSAEKGRVAVNLI